MPQKYNVIDLTQAMNPNMGMPDFYPRPVLINYIKREVKGWAAEIIVLCNHTGTHLDSPFHGIAEGDEILDFPKELFCSDAVLLDVNKEQEEFITVDDIKAAEKAVGINEGDVAILYTGWDKKADRDSEPEKYFTLNPGLSEEGALYLISKKVSIVGIDSPNIDCSVASKMAWKTGKGSPAHGTLFRNGKWIIEGLVNLDEISQKRFTLVTLPLKMPGLTGSPIRSIAIEQ